MTRPFRWLGILLAPVGLACDPRVARRFSLTPFLDLVGGSFDGFGVDSAHIDLGFSFH